MAVSPGVGFGHSGDGFVRFALVENEERIRQAVRGITQGDGGGAQRPERGRRREAMSDGAARRHGPARRRPAAERAVLGRRRARPGRRRQRDARARKPQLPGARQPAAGARAARPAAPRRVARRAAGGAPRDRRPGAAAGGPAPARGDRRRAPRPRWRCAARAAARRSLKRARRRGRLAGAGPAAAARLATGALPRRRAQERRRLRERRRRRRRPPRSTRAAAPTSSRRWWSRTSPTSLVLRAAGKERKPVATLRRRPGEHRHGHGALLVDGAPPGAPAGARLLRRPGIELQRLFTTSEPTADQLDVAQISRSKELLRLEEAGAGARVASADGRRPALSRRPARRSARRLRAPLLAPPRTSASAASVSGVERGHRDGLAARRRARRTRGRRSWCG